MRLATARCIWKNISHPVKHIEMQLLCDNFGGVVCLGERECSMQRKNQKLIEESPSPAVDEELRSHMMEAAVKAARAVAYRGVGTIEFLLDTAHNFYFMEMNTRLQVEHPCHGNGNRHGSCKMADPRCGGYAHGFYAGRYRFARPCH